MKAEFGNIINQKRALLQEVIPLETPYVVAIDPSNICNFECKFCGIQSLKNQVGGRFQFKYMEQELFNKIIDDLCDMPSRLKMLRLAGNGEPLTNPNFVEMTKYAYEKRVAGWIETITNGSLLNHDLNRKLSDCGLDRIRISIEALDNEGYKDMTGRDVNFEKLVDNIADLHDQCKGKCEIYVKTVNAAVPDDEKMQKFKSIFGEICDRIFVDNIVPSWGDFDDIYNRFEIGEGVHGQPVRNVEICPLPYYSCKVHPDGEVTMCCSDWKRQYVLGDLTKESFKDVWNGEKLRQFWIDNAKKQKNKYSICEKCVTPSFDCTDFIDDYSKEISERLASDY